MIKGYEYQSDFAKKYFEQGLLQGRTEAAARYLLDILRTDGIAVPGDVSEDNLAQMDLEQLGCWLEKAYFALWAAGDTSEPS